MTQVKYETTVIGTGELLQEFVNEGILVFFGKEAPEELLETAVVIEHKTEPTADVIPGDIIELGSHSFPVLAVGPVANDNLRNLGHLVIKFNGLEEPEMKGDVCVPEGSIPALTQGTTIRITSSGD